jgi:hypothetical protein
MGALSEAKWVPVVAQPLLGGGGPKIKAESKT